MSVCVLLLVTGSRSATPRLPARTFWSPMVRFRLNPEVRIKVTVGHFAESLASTRLHQNLSTWFAFFVRKTQIQKHQTITNRRMPFPVKPKGSSLGHPCRNRSKTRVACHSPQKCYVFQKVGVFFNTFFWLYITCLKISKICVISSAPSYLF